MDILKNDFEKEAFNGVGVEIDLDCLETDQAEVVKSGDVRDIEYMTLVKIPYSVGFNTSHEKKNPTKICFSDKVNKEEIVDYIPALIFMIKETANYNRH